jgi:MarR family transcriptional regulator, organic hydroperoxide resistance regulator
MTSKPAAKTTAQAGADESPAGQAREMDLTLTAIRQILSRPLTSAFAEGDLTGAQRAVMRVLVEAKAPLSLSSLRQNLGLAQSTVSGIVERLEKRGMITRRSDPADGRGTLLTPSEAVNAFLRTKVPELVRSPLAEALALADSAERRKILESLRRLHQLLRQASSEQSE